MYKASRYHSSDSPHYCEAAKRCNKLIHNYLLLHVYVTFNDSSTQNFKSVSLMFYNFTFCRLLQKLFFICSKSAKVYEKKILLFFFYLFTIMIPSSNSLGPISWSISSTSAMSTLLYAGFKIRWNYFYNIIFIYLYYYLYYYYLYLFLH